MRLDELTPEQRENLSTEEIVQIASKLTNGDLLWCSMPVTPVIKLVVYLNSNAEEHGWIATALEVQSRPHMRRSLYFRTHHVHIQRVRIEGRDDGNACLSVNDIMNIFELDGSVKWEILGVVNEGKGIEQPSWMKPPTNDQR